MFEKTSDAKSVSSSLGWKDGRNTYHPSGRSPSAATFQSSPDSRDCFANIQSLKDYTTLNIDLTPCNGYVTDFD